MSFSVLDDQPIKKKKEGEEKRMSQEEMLLEAAQTGLALTLISKYKHCHVGLVLRENSLHDSVFYFLYTLSLAWLVHL